jgi:cell division protein FtsI/penicillin-binding protein 2
MNLAHAARGFGFGEQTGIDLPGEPKGIVPDDLDQNRTGLYSFSIGQHSFEITPVQSAVMLATIANKGAVVKPHVLKQMEGPERRLLHEVVSESSPALPEKIFKTTTLDHEENIVFCHPTEIRRSLPFPTEVFETITKGMRQVVIGPRGSGRPSIMRQFYDHPHAVSDYREIHHDLIAKTGTPQIRYKQTLSKTAYAVTKDHIWFAAISYPKSHLLESNYDDPELVVVVFLRFRQSGRDGGTIAAQVIKEWRKLLALHGEK